MRKNVCECECECEYVRDCVSVCECECVVRECVVSVYV